MKIKFLVFFLSLSAAVFGQRLDTTIINNIYNGNFTGQGTQNVLLIMADSIRAGGGGGISYSDTNISSTWTSKVLSPYQAILKFPAFADTSASATWNKKYSSIFGLHDSLLGYVQRKDSNVKAGYATIYYVSQHGGWSLTGNSGTSPSSNFIGTTDAENLVFKANNVQAGVLDVGTTDNTYFGVQANQSNGGTYNTAMGYQCFGGHYVGCTGNYNVSIGYENMTEMTSGNYNTSEGYWGMRLAFSSAYYNTSNGALSLTNVGTGISNTATGMSSLLNTTSSYNTALGDSAGYTNTTGSYNQFYGYKDTGTSSTVTGEINFGNKANTKLFVLWGKAAFVKPIQHNTATSGTVVADGSEVLSLEGAATTLTITAPSSPIDGQCWEIITNQTSITISFSSGATFNSAPSVVTKGGAVRFIYNFSTSSWANN